MEKEKRHEINEGFDPKIKRNYGRYPWGSTVKNVFISIPMRGRASDSILDSIISMAQISAVAFGFGKDDTVMFHHNYYDDKNTCNSNLKCSYILNKVDDAYMYDIDCEVIVDNPDIKNIKLNNIAQAFDKMSKCEYFIGVEYSGKYVGCDLESRAAQEYGMQTYLVNIDGMSSFEDITRDPYDDLGRLL